MRQGLIIVPLCALLALTALSGCHHPAVKHASQPANGSRGEAVFRLQNSVMDNLIAAQVLEPPGTDAEQTEIASLEDALVEACTELNQAADLSATGDKPGVLLNLRVLISLSDCERSAFAAETFLKRDRTLLGASLP